MTPGEAVIAVRKAGHIVIIHAGAVFFNTSDEVEARKWEDRGAVLVPWYTDEEKTHFNKRQKRVTMGWEVHFLGALERIEMEDVDGALMDVTKDMLLAAARDKAVA